MLLKVVDNGEHKDIHINEGAAISSSILTFRGDVPPTRKRSALAYSICRHRRHRCGTKPACEFEWYDIPRKGADLDRLRWYCSNCGEIVHEEVFHLVDLGTQIKTAVEKFAGSEELRTCKNCGTVAKTKLYDS